MNEITVTKARIRSGVWEGTVTADSDAVPVIIVTHLEKPIDGVEMIPVQGEAGLWSLKVPIPVDALSDGVQTFRIEDAETGARLESFTIVTGETLEDDIRAEVDLLRAELDMLKRAFRRHCVESMGD